MNFADPVVVTDGCNGCIAIIIQLLKVVGVTCNDNDLGCYLSLLLNDNIKKNFDDLHECLKRHSQEFCNALKYLELILEYGTKDMDRFQTTYDCYLHCSSCGFDEKRPCKVLISKHRHINHKNTKCILCGIEGANWISKVEYGREYVILNGETIRNTHESLKFYRLLDEYKKLADIYCINDQYFMKIIIDDQAWFINNTVVIKGDGQTLSVKNLLFAVFRRRQQDERYGLGDGINVLSDYKKKDSDSNMFY